MLPVVWLDSAVEDLQSILDFVAEANPQAAYKLAAQLIEDADNLGVLPAFCRRNIGEAVSRARMSL
jgi:plasmid stabilization system protein ParE